MKKMLLILSSLIFIGGCIDKKILDDVQLATLVGYDLNEEGQLKAITIAPEYKPDDSVKNLTFSASGTLSKELRDILNLESSLPFVSGKIVVTLYSEKLAKKGILEIIDTLERDPSVGSRVYLATAENDLNKHLNVQFGSTDNGMYLTKLIEHNIKNGMVPKTNLHQFTKALYGEGVDPFLPFITFKGDKAKINGIALFKDDKLVDKINDKEGYFFKILVEKSSTDAAFLVKINENDHASVYSTSSNRTYDIKNTTETPSIKIIVTVEAAIREYTGHTITKKKIKAIEKKLEKEIKEKSEKLIQRFQEENIDPLGIGYQIKTRNRNWNQEEWDEIYPSLEINVEPRIKIIESGIIE
jgi:spore germination protein